jgi:hypothetical protein
VGCMKLRVERHGTLATGQRDRRIEAWPAATARLISAQAAEALKCELTIIMLYWFLPHFTYAEE